MGDLSSSLWLTADSPHVIANLDQRSVTEVLEGEVGSLEKLVAVTSVSELLSAMLLMRRDQWRLAAEKSCESQSGKACPGAPKLFLRTSFLASKLLNISFDTGAVLPFSSH